MKPSAVALTACLLAAPALGSPPPSTGYEEPPTLVTAKLLSPELLEGPRHAVDPEARTDGYMAYFTIHSHYGTYQTASIEETTIRIHEIYAIEALEDMKRYEAAAKGAVEGIQKPFLSVRSVVTRPEETLENLGNGIGRWIERGKLSLHKAGRKAKKAAIEVKESVDRQLEDRRAERLAEQEVRDRALAENRDPDLAVAEYRARRKAELDSDLAEQSDARRNQERALWIKEQLGKASRKYLGYDKARRQLARDLGVDPYTTNLHLQETLDARAWSLWAGAFGIDFVLPSSRAVDRLSDVDELVWSTGPKDLEVANRKAMKAMGIERKTIHLFFENPWYTASDRTRMVHDLETLRGVGSRDHFFVLAEGAEERLLATFYSAAPGCSRKHTPGHRCEPSSPRATPSWHR